MSRFESSRFVRNPQVMHVDVLKSACEALGWTYCITGDELLVSDAKQDANLYGEFALKLNLTILTICRMLYRRLKSCKNNSMP